MPLRFLPKQKLALATILYWFLLLYIIAALLFWYIRLQEQSSQMANYRLMELVADDPQYLKKVEQINEESIRKTHQYRGEGATFLFIILVGAVFVFRAVRRQFKVAQQQQNFMMAITHELKTPIAVAKLNLETLQKHKLDEEKKDKLIRMTLQETNRLNTLTNNILISSQLEGGGYKLVKEDLDLSALISRLVMDFKQRFPDRTWILEIPDSIHLKADPLLIQILINNLLDNAVKYSPRSASVQVKLGRGTSNVEMSIADQGPGIPDEEKGKIFKRFYRIGNESVRTTQGTGLGLYLCKKITTDHRGSIRVSDNQPSGANFIVQLPNN
ncbi:ATP-binding protein [Flavihumibacter sp. RY-1]|uniref:histidine kinase n=1 Tax=Flavihumibacter fluminis TaxID=2909236 RepID=A0ABS9BPR9_9BACT|nr:ATP-binding protein [Flavihumibacter fluminis]MCF1717008.1 ATP-binding protein [Flavihumibacter fluminis]